MRIAIFIITAMLLFSINGNCQENKWYFKQYGVPNINQLSTEQLNEALSIAKKKATPGKVILIGGMVCSATGLLVLLSTIGSEEDSGSKAKTGSLLLLGGLIAGGGGAMWASVYTSRSREIKRTLKSRGVKIGLINNPTFNISADCKNSLVPGLAITFDF
jgi:hypothetical protein